MNDILKFVVGTIIILSVGITLAIIGIQHEHLTKLRDRKAELEIMLKDSEDKIKSLQKELKDTKEENKALEKELMKYDKKRKKAEKDRKN